MLVTPEILLKFSSFRQLSKDQLMMLVGAGEVEMLQASSGTKIITRGSNDDYSFFLVEGTLKLIARDGQTAIIKADSASAKQPITQLKPRQYDVIADGTVSYLQIDSQVLENLSLATQTQSAGIQVENESGNADVYFQLYHDIKADYISLPSFADAAQSINKLVLTPEKVTTPQLEQLILSDPAVTAKLIKLAYSSHTDNHSFVLNDVTDIIPHLGLNRVVDVVRVLSVKDVFKPVNPKHKALFKEMWLESVYVGAIASALAEEQSGLNPKKAQLFGLLHNVGPLLILDNLGKDKALVTQMSQMRGIIDELGCNIGSMLLDKWGFPAEMVEAVKSSQQWQRSSSGNSLDYCDLLILAKLLGYVGTSKTESLPVITGLPAFYKLGWGKNDIARGSQILSKAKQRMRNLAQVFEV